MVREYAHSGTAALFQNRNSRRFTWSLVICQGSPGVGILHSSMTEDISVIFWKFPCEKMKECVPDGIELISLGVLSLASAHTTITL
jgi:hypothetical protein